MPGDVGVFEGKVFTRPEIHPLLQLAIAHHLNDLHHYARVIV